jgi:hypothetical protein
MAAARGGPPGSATCVHRTGLPGPGKGGSSPSPSRRSQPRHRDREGRIKIWRGRKLAGLPCFVQERRRRDGTLPAPGNGSGCYGWGWGPPPSASRRTALAVSARNLLIAGSSLTTMFTQRGTSLCWVAFSGSDNEDLLRRDDPGAAGSRPSAARPGPVLSGRGGQDRSLGAGRRFGRWRRPGSGRTGPRRAGASRDPVVRPGDSGQHGQQVEQVDQPLGS